MKKALVILLALMMVLGVCACASEPATSSAAPSSSAAEAASSEKEEAPAEKVELEVWQYHSDGSTSSDAFYAGADDYNKLDDRLANVTVQYIPRNDLLKKYALGAVSGELPDVGIVDNPDAATYAAMGTFVAVDDYIKDWEYNDFLAGPMKSGQYDGKQYSLPYHSNCLGFWVNDEMWVEAGLDLNKIPVTWDEMLESFATLKAALPATTYAYAQCVVKSEEGTFQFIPHLYSTGADVTKIGTAEGIKAFKLMETLVTNGYISAEAINWTQNDVQKQFASGNAATMMNGSWHLATMARDLPDMAFTIAAIPKDKEHATCMGGENLAICAGADVDAAWDFVSYFLGYEAGLKNNQAAGTVYPHTGVPAADQYDDPKMQQFIELLGGAVPRGPSPQWGELSLNIQEALQAVMTGAKTAEQAATDCAAAIDGIDGLVVG